VPRVAQAGLAGRVTQTGVWEEGEDVERVGRDSRQVRVEFPRQLLPRVVLHQQASQVLPLAGVQLRVSVLQVSFPGHDLPVVTEGRLARGRVPVKAEAVIAAGDQSLAVGTEEGHVDLVPMSQRVAHRVSGRSFPEAGGLISAGCRYTPAIRTEVHGQDAGLV